MDSWPDPAPATAGATPRLDAALLQAQQSIRAVEKTARNEHHRYSYASAEAIIAEARAALASLGVLVGVSWEVIREGGGRVVPELVGTFRLSHPASGEWRIERAALSICESKGRPADKAESAAQTTLLAYHLRDLLLIPRVAEGDDIAARDDREHEHEPRRRQQAPEHVSGVVARVIEEARTQVPADPLAAARRAVGPYVQAHGAEALRELAEARGLPEDRAAWTAKQWIGFAEACRAEWPEVSP